ncbi:MAG: serine/threonine protein kinase [candidate division Zixibacteria bacterium]|nr:serine/threonine protein kinase [candidate division Zixibacteria bacterium]
MQQATETNIYPVIPDYEITSKIGQGGIAEIFKARQVSLNRDVAIKMIFPDLTNDPEIVRRFDYESLTIARLNHPNIVHVIDRGQTADNRYYFVMEYVDGTSFKEIITNPKYTIRQKLEVLTRVLKGLDYAHKNGVIHRDVKPANILIDREGNVQVADFGIAQIVNKPDQEMTSSDVIMGTLAYMSPEQKLSSANVTLATDIYAVGIMLYEILAGQKPLGRFKLPSEVNPKVDSRFDDVVARCLSQEPSDRYQSAVELKDEILNIISHQARANGTQKKVTLSDSFVGKCQYLETLKETKHSSTVLVEHTENHQLYVIKTKERSDAGLKEARILRNAGHKNIIKIIGAGGDARKMVLMTEYAPGGSLADRMVKTYPLDSALEIIIPAVDALEHAHRVGIIHGNLRPSNILFTGDNEVRLADFGLPPHYSLMDKNWYAPPEKKTSKQGDIYALGVILYQLLVGKNPVYDRASQLYLGDLQDNIPDAIKKIIKKMLALRISQRYADAEELLKDWEAYQESLNKPKAKRVDHGAIAREQQRRQRIKQLIIFGSIGIAAIAAAIIAFLLK